MSARPSHPSAHPNASILRHRASALRSFAGTLDQLLVTRIDAQELTSAAAHTDAKRWHVRRLLLDHNLHQLHRAADELREVAHQMWQCADSLERSTNFSMTSGV